jgi:pyrroloquinoline-quinone synthase
MRLLYTTALYWDYVAQDISPADLDMAENTVPQGERALLQA